MTRAITVVVPVYNGAPFLAEAIESALMQQLPADEIIVVDDGSTDATPSVIERFSGKLVALRQQNQGPAAARNAGIERARTPLIAFLDADDLFLPSTLADLVASLGSDAEADVIWGRTDRLFMPDAGAAHPDWHGRPQWALAVGSMLFRRQRLIDIGGFDADFRAGEDMDLLVRLRERKARIIRDPRVVHIRRIHGANGFTADEDAVSDAHFRVLGKAMARRRIARAGCQS
ncbi:MAG TPA: glycosyltransferase family A protein [Allosphingosinicella sp.]|nr:glycosyltransferase family A protein [Allosphingosinicella sp.]